MRFTASVIGLGSLGSCLAASLAYRGIPTVGHDIDEGVVKAFRAGVAPSEEPDLQRYIDEMDEGDLQATTDPKAIRDTDVSFIFVNTPSDERGRYDLESVLGACRSVGRQLAKMDDYHLVVLRSTVMPGSTTGEVRRVLEEESGKTAGEDFGLCYCPEFTAVGEVIEGMERPDFFLVGEHDERAGDVLSELYREWVEDPAPVVRTDVVSAEVAKMTVNTYISTKISFANTLAQICDGVGGDVDEVTRVIGNDSRINDRYLTAGTRFGGPCFPRDNVAFDELARDARTTAPIARATDEVNDAHTEWIADAVRCHAPASGSVVVLGVTYKPGVPVVTESQGRELLERLDGEFDLMWYDPNDVDPTGLPEGSQMAASAEEATRAADAVVITTQEEQFADPSLYDSPDVVVIDPWRILSMSELPSDVTHVPIGRSSQPT